TQPVAEELTAKFYPLICIARQSLLQEESMFKILLQYVPLGPVIVALLLFVLLPFDEVHSITGMFYFQ
ncbi:MAG TPA: hypothetical protein VGL10_08215, partial [Gammaproteobacteria bacterium]